MVAIAQQSPPLIGRLLDNAAVEEAFISAVTDSPSEEFTVAALKYIVVLFPLFPDMHVPFVDLELSEHLGSESPPLLEAVIAWRLHCHWSGILRCASLSTWTL
jgi:hypothetical protein